MASRRILILFFIMSTPNFASAQTRELRSLPATPPPAAGGTSAASARLGDSLSTGITSATVELGPGDLLEVTVFDTQELTQKVRVSSNGRVVLALIGEVDVRGITTDTLQGLIREKLVTGRFVKDPQVSVFALEFAGQTANITGEVNRPGAYPLMRSHHLMDMLAVAGGLSSRAGNTVAITHSRTGTLPMLVDLSDKDLARRDPEINPGDSITVGETGIVYVLGDVMRPGGFLLDRRGTLSVVQAVALAEGTTPSASIRKLELIRVADGKRVVVPIDLKGILKAHNPDLQMEAGDILYVPTSLIRGLGRASIQTILATASGVAVYSSAYR